MIKKGEIMVGNGKIIKEKIAKGRKEIEEEAKRFRKEVQKNTATAILAAFGFVIALVWRDAIQESIDKLLKVLNLTGTGFIYKILTAIIVTIICVIGIMEISKWSEKKE